ncbi:MAG: hypothetical protein M3Y84_00030 [Acidobacteriota bacterium]|nr:hypothetical protein [Acidobacteriota bacterium]
MNAHIGFNPRAGKNSDALSDYVLTDLRSASPKAIDNLIGTGNLVPGKNKDVAIGAAGLTVRNIDLVIREKDPTLSIQLSVENKSIMAAHGKARKNRYGDLISYCNHMHNHRRDCIAGATVVINTSEAYENPDSFARGLLRPRVQMDRVVAGTIRIFESIPLRDSPDDPPELPEALAVIMLNYDGVNPATLIEGVPDILNPSHYDNFIKRLVAKYEDRFGA